MYVTFFVTAETVGVQPVKVYPFLVGLVSVILSETILNLFSKIIDKLDSNKCYEQYMKLYNGSDKK